MLEIVLGSLRILLALSHTTQQIQRSSNENPVSEFRLK